jgi:hypothetical protein
MHELGHNLGLHHGGDVDTNLKPNYLSVMNYAFHIGIRRSDTVGSTVPDFALRHLDYSEQVLPTGGNTPGALDETNLNEPAGLGSGTADITIVLNCGAPSRVAPSTGPVDWNGDGTANDLHAQAIVNRFYPCDPADPVNPGPDTMLHGFDDWSYLHSTLAASANGQALRRVAPTISPPDPPAGNADPAKRLVIKHGRARIRQ